MTITAKNKSNTKKKSTKKDEATIVKSKKISSKSIFKSASAKQVGDFLTKHLK
jgi:hypothetical protein